MKTLRQARKKALILMRMDEREGNPSFSKKYKVCFAPL